MLLSVVALVVGSGIGKARGGSWLGVTSTRIRGKGFLVVGIGATLVLNVLDPSSPMFWLSIATISFIGFAISNLAITGMIVLLIGLLLNVLPIVANGSVPVSERALESIGEVDDAGQAVVEGPRESTETATGLRFLGDVVPVPLFDKVISLGDLIVLVALADVSTNLFLRRRKPDAVHRGSSNSQGQDADEPVLDLTDAHATDGPAHAAPGSRLFSAPLPRVRRPGHAAPTRPHRPSDAPAKAEHATPAKAEHAAPADSQSIPADDPPVPDPDPPGTDDVVDLTDRRPIIDLTVSPTDEQLAEFLRRRADADRQLAQLAPPSPGHRRYRSRLRRRRGELADTPG